MTKRWIKNGVFASDTIELNGCVVCNPTEDMLRQAGYEEYVEPPLTEKEKLEQAKSQYDFMNWIIENDIMGKDEIYPHLDDYDYLDDEEEELYNGEE